MRDSAEFWDERADKYSKKPVRDMENYNKTLVPTGFEPLDLPVRRPLGWAFRRRTTTRRS